MESYELLWRETLPELEKTISSISFDTYIVNLTPVDLIGSRLILCTPSAIFADQINGRLKSKISEALCRANSEVTDFQIVVAKDRDEYVKKIEEDAGGSLEEAGSPINPKFTFESFVVGSSNEFSFHAAKAVADNPGDAYNPLFIHGGTGLGKTHLLMAIANHLKLHKPRTRVLYATCEQFVNQMVESLSKGKLTPQAFRNKFRNVDVLLIDDVQFISKKQSSQVEFFHTFNELVMQNKQVVLSSDRPPEEIEYLEERLKTRFSGGLLADVQVPDLETRIAILRKKSEEQKCLVDIKVLSFIAETSEADIRTLIGKLTKVIFASKLHERPITIDLVKEALKESAGEKQEELKVDDIINCVCNFYKVNKADVIGKKKNKEFIEPRQVCAYLITEMMSLPLVTVGKSMGGRDHATIIYARDKIAEQIKNDDKLRVQINDIKKMLLKE
jgi:chromosomal replication initiator protein